MAVALVLVSALLIMLSLGVMGGGLICILVNVPSRKMGALISVAGFATFAGSISVVMAVGPSVSEPKTAQAAPTAPIISASAPPALGDAEEPVLPWPKRDLLRIVLGMAPEVVARRFQGACSPIGGTMTCKNDNGTLTVTFTKGLPREQVKAISLIFKSGATPQATIENVSAQFDRRPTKADWSAEIKYAQTTRWEFLPGIFSKGDYVPTSGGPICKWALDDGVELALDLNRPSYAERPNEYILKLSSPKYELAEKAAEQQRLQDKVEKARAVNPAPKF